MITLALIYWCVCILILLLCCYISRDRVVGWLWLIASSALRWTSRWCAIYRRGWAGKHIFALETWHLFLACFVSNNTIIRVFAPLNVPSRDCKRLLEHGSLLNGSSCGGFIFVFTFSSFAFIVGLRVRTTYLWGSSRFSLCNSIVRIDLVGIMPLAILDAWMLNGTSLCHGEVLGILLARVEKGSIPQPHLSRLLWFRRHLSAIY